MKGLYERPIPRDVVVQKEQLLMLNGFKGRLDNFAERAFKIIVVWGKQS